MNTDVHELVDRYLADVDAALPGFVEMLYLTGSVALGAFQPGVSDIDALIVTSRSPSPADLAASLADRATRRRTGEPIAFTAADGRAAADSIDAVVADALRRWG